MRLHQGLDAQASTGGQPFKVFAAQPTVDDGHIDVPTRQRIGPGLVPALKQLRARLFRVQLQRVEDQHQVVDPGHDIAHTSRRLWACKAGRERPEPRLRGGVECRLRHIEQQRTAAGRVDPGLKGAAARPGRINAVRPTQNRS